MVSNMLPVKWYHKFHQVITSNSFEVNLVEDCVYHKFMIKFDFMSMILYLLVVIWAYCMKLRNFSQIILR